MSIAADVRRRLLSQVTPQDAELAGLRLASRAAIVQPLVLAFTLAFLHDAQVTLFCFFFGLWFARTRQSRRQPRSATLNDA